MPRKKKALGRSTTAKPAPPSAQTPAEERGAPVEEHAFTVVGIGASAGGLEAFTQLLRALPADTGMAFVLVQHLAPNRRKAAGHLRVSYKTLLNKMKECGITHPDAT